MSPPRVHTNSRVGGRHPNEARRVHVGIIGRQSANRAAAIASKRVAAADGLVGDDEVGPADGGQRDTRALPHAARPRAYEGTSGSTWGERSSRSKAKSRKPLVDAPHRVEDAHRLHDVGHVLPANRVQLPFGSGEGVDLAVAKTAGDGAPDDPQGRADGAGEGQEETNGSTV